MSIVWISGILFATSMILLAVISFFILIFRKFKTYFIMPADSESDPSKGKKWFIIQTFALVFGAFIVLMRAWQKSGGHSDNVSENLIYFVSGFLLVRAIGEFKVMGLFRSEDRGDFTQFDKKFLTPIAIVLFLLSLPLI